MKWQTLKSSYLIKRWWMNLREDHVKLPNGAELREYHVLEYPDWVCTVCVTEDGRLVMVEQYRYGIDEMTLELPGGAIDPGESPESAARRELLEETGYTAEAWQYLGKAAPDPTRQTNWAWFFVATGGRRSSEQQLDESEEMHVRLLPVDDALALADSGGLAHGMHLTALLLASHKGLIPTT